MSATRILQLYDSDIEKNTMKPVGCSAFLLSAAFVVCLCDLFLAERAGANGVEMPIPEKSSQASELQLKTPQNTKVQIQGEVVSNPLPPPGGRNINDVPNVFPGPDFAKSAGKVKEVAKETGLLETMKSISEVVKNVFEVIAIIVGGFWTYTLFVRQRQKYPRANLTHKLSHRPLGNGKVLLNIDATLSNAGGVLIRIVSGELRIQHVLPLSARVAKETADSENQFPVAGREYSWDTSCHSLKLPSGPCEIEPGEDNQFHYDCVLPDCTEVIKVYTYYKNEAKSGREIGWNLTTIYDTKVPVMAMKKEDDMTSSAQSDGPKPMPMPMPQPGPEPLQEGPKPRPGPRG